MTKKLTPTQEAKARIEAEIARVESEIIRAARERKQRIGITADEKLQQILDNDGDVGEFPATPQFISAIKLGLQRGGLLVEKHEVVDVKRPLREASEEELIAELNGRDDDAK
jgi:hypothetical protein